MDSATLFLVASLGLAGIVWWFKRGAAGERPPSPNKLPSAPPSTRPLPDPRPRFQDPTPDPAEADLQRFVRRLSGDRQAAERLIAYESKMTPGIDRHQAIKAAIERYERDRR